MRDDNPSPGGANLDSQLHQLLSGNDKAWDNCTLGPVPKWPQSLKSYATTLSALPYPAAVLWGDDYVLVHNKFWDEAGGITHQGQSQKNGFSKETLQKLGTVSKRRNAQEMQSHDLLQKKSNRSTQYSVAILSPLQTPGQDCIDGIMVQLVPKPMQLGKGSGDAEKGNSNAAMIGADGQVPHDIVEAVDNAPIDEHPFFRRFAEMLPSGLAILDHNAQAVFVNQHFYDLTTLKGDEKEFTSWPQSIHDDDYDRVMDAYKKAFESQKQLRTEFRAKGEPHPWRLLLLTPLGDENLQHVSLREYGGFICSIVDISSEKSAEISERKAAQQARERKEQQERFIDMISHEIRNPLSAVLHCAEDIGDAVKDDGSVDIGTIKEAVETIHLCVTHQKNIVDDVLSFSKLDASLLSLVPKPAEPARQLQNTLKMFQHEFRKQHFEFQYSIDDIYDQCHVEWVLADLARISQVLINLITNAIKFTHHAKGKKLIQCSVAASIERPSSYPPDVVFFESDNLAHKMDATNTTEWGNGEVLYILVAVRDTGIGISAEGQKRLFERFRQATPKTEEVYGGSGLGLNISRKICHLHGGEIGVSSKEGEGSTFGFFFKVRRTGPPSDTDEASKEEREGNDQLRGKIEAAGSKSPKSLDSKEPFEWSPGGDGEKVDKPRPETVSEPNNSASVKNELSASIASPTKEREEQNAKGLKNYDQFERPRLSGEHRTSSIMVSADVSAPSSPGLEEPHRPVTSLKNNQTRAHVLLVEDNVINQKIVYRKLEAKGFNVTTANNGKEAVEAVQAAPKPSSGDKGAFDVILMDQEMPILDGNGATKQIRELESAGKVEHIPILGVTANVRGAQQDEMLASGMDDVISKPYKIEEMVSKIKQVAQVDDGGKGHKP